MSTLIRQQGFAYAFDAAACAECGGRCCTGESGNIFVTRSEVEAMAAHLQMEKQLFAQHYLLKKGYKYTLKEQRVGMSYDCIFYSRDAGGCLVYDVRPQQCRTFPFWDYFKTNMQELHDECPGIVDD